MRRLPADQRRAELLDATAAVILEKGFARATTRELAAELKIGRGLIHHYFPSWEALRREAFAHCAQTELDTLCEATEAMAPVEALSHILDALVPDPGDRYWRLWNDAWDEAQRNPEFTALYASLMELWRQLLMHIIRSGMDQGVFRCHNPEDAAWRLLGLADGLGGYLLLPESPLSRTHVLHHVRRQAALELGAEFPNGDSGATTFSSAEESGKKDRPAPGSHEP